MKAGEKEKVEKKKGTATGRHAPDPDAPIQINISEGSLHIYPKAKRGPTSGTGEHEQSVWDDLDMVTWYILGGTCEDEAVIPKNDLDYVELSFLGLPKACIIHVAKFMNIPMKDMADLVNLSIKTLERKKLGDPMDKIVSSHVIEMAGALAHGMKVFEDQLKLNSWLSKENRALDGRRPVELLSTPTGIKLVNNILTRIEEGVFS